MDLEPDVVTLLESDSVILVGTVAPDGLPEASRGWGLTVRTDADARAHERSFAALAEAIQRADGTDPALLGNRKPGALTAVVATLEEVYDQTPGPAAGARLAPTEAPQ